MRCQGNFKEVFSFYSIFLQERDLEAERRLKTITCVVESLDCIHNSSLALVQGVRDARLRISVRNPQLKRRRHTCVGREVSNRFYSCIVVLLID